MCNLQSVPKSCEKPIFLKNSMQTHTKNVYKEKSTRNTMKHYKK